MAGSRKNKRAELGMIKKNKGGRQESNEQEDDITSIVYQVPRNEGFDKT